MRDGTLSAIASRTSTSRILNTLVYRELGARNLEMAVELAVLQALMNPSSANPWDTLGEAYYFLGEVEIAREYERHSREIDPDFTAAGEAVWAEDLAEYQKRWAEMDGGS